MSAETRCAQACVLSIAWKAAAVGWALVIFYLSTGRFGPTFTAPLLAGALSLIHVTLPPPSFDVVHLCVRKAAHLAEYAIFAFLLGESSKEPPFPWRRRRLLGCFLILVVYSLTDEYHQSFVPGRTASLTDCGIDSIGGAMGMLVYYVNNLRLRAICPTKSGAS
jgi:VanZ family protein